MSILDDPSFLNLPKFGDTQELLQPYLPKDALLLWAGRGARSVGRWYLHGGVMVLGALFFVLAIFSLVFVFTVPHRLFAIPVAAACGLLGFVGYRFFHYGDRKLRQYYLLYGITDTHLYLKPPYSPLQSYVLQALPDLTVKERPADSFSIGYYEEISTPTDNTHPKWVSVLEDINDHLTVFRFLQQLQQQAKA